MCMGGGSFLSRVSSRIFSLWGSFQSLSRPQLQLTFLYQKGSRDFTVKLGASPKDAILSNLHFVPITIFRGLGSSCSSLGGKFCTLGGGPGALK